MPNPRIHLLLVLAVATALPWMPWQSLLALAVMLGSWHLAQGVPALQALGRGLWRLKWLLLALGLVYLWLSESDNGWLAMAEAGRRTAILMLMYTAVHTLLYRLSPRELTGLLIQVLRPLDHVGLPGQRFGHRLGLLVAKAVDQRKQLAQRHKAEGGGWISWIPRVLAAEIRQIESAAGQSAGAPEEPLLPPPSAWRDYLLGLAGLVLILVLLLWPMLPLEGGFGV